MIRSGSDTYRMLKIIGEPSAFGKIIGVEIYVQDNRLINTHKVLVVNSCGNCGQLDQLI